MDRRTAVGALVGAGVAVRAKGSARRPVSPSARLKQSVCRWCYQDIQLDVLCREAAKIGLVSVELLGEQEWAIPKRFGLTCAMANGPSTIPVGFNRPDQHDRLVAESERLLPLVAQAGLPNMIVFSGNRGNLSDAEGVENCVRGIKRIVGTAERLGVTVCMELLNSKVDHKDYQCDHTPFGVEVVKRVGSPRFKLLYDIYHMQIMEGDVIHTIRDNHQHIAHYHTAGVPGRHEIDESQELFYPAVMKAIVDTGYTGYVAQEFVPVKKELGMVSLEDAYKRCAV